MKFYVSLKFVGLILADIHKVIIKIREAMNFYPMVLSFVHSKELQLRNVYYILRHDTALEPYWRVIMDICFQLNTTKCIH